MTRFLTAWAKFIGFLALCFVGAGVLIAIISLLMDHVSPWAAGVFVFLLVTAVFTAAFLDLDRRP